MRGGRLLVAHAARARLERRQWGGRAQAHALAGTHLGGVVQALRIATHGVGAAQGHQLSGRVAVALWVWSGQNSELLRCAALRGAAAAQPAHTACTAGMLPAEQARDSRKMHSRREMVSSLPGSCAMSLGPVASTRPMGILQAHSSGRVAEGQSFARQGQWCALHTRDN